MGRGLTLFFAPDHLSINLKLFPWKLDFGHFKGSLLLTLGGNDLDLRCNDLVL